MTKVTLNDLSNLQNENSAVTTINGNSATIETAFDNTLSRDGSAPNQMEADLDMNSNRILNLPHPESSQEPLRVAELAEFLGTGSISFIPAGGDSGEILSKLSNADYDVGWIVNSGGGGDASEVSVVSTRTDLKALDTTQIKMALLTEDKRTGLFVWSAGDFSSKITADTQEGLFIKADAVASTSGAWVRVVKDYIHSGWFGAVGDFDTGTTTGTDDTAALQAWLDMCLLTTQGYMPAWLDNGDYKITSSLKGRTYISITASSNRWARIFPVMSSGPAISFDQNVSGYEGSYQQTISNIWINGSNSTGTACAIAFGISKNTKIELCRFTDFSGTSVGAVQINGANYALTFELNAFSDNVQHIASDRVTGSGNFPTDCAFYRNTFDTSTDQAALAAILFRNSSSFIFKNNVLQSNQAKYTLLCFQDATAETNPNHIIAENWFENNGQTQSGSVEILAAGTDNANPSLARLAAGIIIRDNSFYGSPSNTVIEIDDGKDCIVKGNREPGGGANASFLTTGGYLATHKVDLSQMASSTAFHGFDVNIAASIVSIASSAITSQVAQNISCTRNSSGSFTFTFVKNPKNNNYVVNASCEKENIGQILSANPYNPQNGSFSILVHDKTDTAVDPRTLWVNVRGVG